MPERRKKREGPSLRLNRGAAFSRWKEGIMAYDYEIYTFVSKSVRGGNGRSATVSHGVKTKLEKGDDAIFWANRKRAEVIDLVNGALAGRNNETRIITTLTKRRSENGRTVSKEVKEIENTLRVVGAR